MDIQLLKVLIQEEKYPTFTDEELEQMAAVYDSIYQLAYVCCLMKAETQDIKVGPISIKNDAELWRQLAALYLAQYQDSLISDNGKGTTLTGMVMQRADE